RSGTGTGTGTGTGGTLPGGIGSRRAMKPQCLSGAFRRRGRSRVRPQLVILAQRAQRSRERREVSARGERGSRGRDGVASSIRWGGGAAPLRSLLLCVLWERMDVPRLLLISTMPTGVHRAPALTPWWTCGVSSDLRLNLELKRVLAVGAADPVVARERLLDREGLAAGGAARLHPGDPQRCAVDV